MLEARLGTWSSNEIIGDVVFAGRVPILTLKKIAEFDVD